jgi:hypothetical protein
LPYVILYIKQFKKPEHILEWGNNKITVYNKTIEKDLTLSNIYKQLINIEKIS